MSSNAKSTTDYGDRRVEVVAVAEVERARADEKARIVARIRHSADVIDGAEVSRTARTLNRMALLIEAELPDA